METIEPASISLRMPSERMPHQISQPHVRFAKPQSPQRGLWVVLLGPDGAGKSAVIASIGSGRSAGFTGSATYHLRPDLFPRSGEPMANYDPHGQLARGTLVSVCKLAYLLAVNWLGYFMAVRPQRARGKLVLFDRYFPDCL